MATATKPAWMNRAMLDTAWQRPGQIEAARLMQRRLRAALKTSTFSTGLLEKRARHLKAIRSHGTCYALNAFLRDYADSCESELRTAVRWRYTKPFMVREMAA